MAFLDPSPFCIPAPSTEQAITQSEWVRCKLKCLSSGYNDYITELCCCKA
jgi:hypothetical protein